MSQGGFVTVINDIFFWIIWFFELVGALVIIIGALVCLCKYIKSLIKKKKLPIKLLLANQLSTGLEFMLAAEILKTVITDHNNFGEISVLISIVLLRIALTLLLHFELKSEEKQIEVSEKINKRLATKADKNA